MMKRFQTLIIIVVATVSTCYAFNNCANTDFCSQFRTRQPTDNYVVDPESISGGTDSNKLTATLKSNNGDVDLSLTLFGLYPDIFRIKITELNSTRYELQDVLNGEPVTVNFDTVEKTESYVQVSTGLKINSARINFSPFNIEFGKYNLTEVVFEGSRLILTQNEINAPFTFGVSYPEAVQLYGLHEHSDSLALRNTGANIIDPYRLKNLDRGPGVNSTVALYGAVPVLYGHGPKATAGIFLHNAAEEWIDISNNVDGNSKAYFMVETGTLDLFILLGQTPADVIKQYLVLTGTPHLPPFWALGYHQCRYSYESQEDVKEVVANFDNYNFQMDAIWLDIDYTDSFKYFTWNPNTFSDPLDMQWNISTTFRKLVTIIDPHIKVDQTYSIYDDALAAGFFVKKPDGSVFEGNCWPGLSTWMDFLNPGARDFYALMYGYDNFINSTSVLAGIWNDMNEPSVFDGIENTLPPDSIHDGGVQHRNVHNIYGLLHTMSTHKGLLMRDKGVRRPFILTRSHFAGSQRYAAIWTGDNSAIWPHLLASFQVCLTANILGIVFCGSDVGGFGGNPTDELFQRWYQAGAWLPFFRSHSGKGTERREPYLKSEEVQAVVRSAIQTRYQHLPVWYTLFYEHIRNNEPVIRPLFYHYPEDVDVYKIDNQLLVGRDILVRAVYDEGASSVSVYFPGGSEEFWLSLEGNDVYSGNGFAEVTVDIQSIPVYYRRGSVIFRKETIRKSTVNMDTDGYTLYVTLDANNTAYGTVYIDDNTSFNYRDGLDYNYISVTFSGYDIVTIHEIDWNSTGRFQFSIDKIVYKNITEFPKGSKPGRYQDVVFNKDVNGNLFKDIKINPKEQTVFNLK